MQSDTRPSQRLIGNLRQSIKFRRDLMSHSKIIAIGTVTFHRFVLKISVHTPCGYCWECTSVRGVDVLGQQYQRDTEKHLLVQKHVVDIAPTNHEHWSTGDAWHEHDQLLKKRHDSIMSPFVGHKM